MQTVNKYLDCSDCVRRIAGGAAPNCFAVCDHEQFKRLGAAEPAFFISGYGVGAFHTACWTGTSLPAESRQRGNTKLSIAWWQEWYRDVLWCERCSSGKKWLVRRNIATLGAGEIQSARIPAPSAALRNSVAQRYVWGPSLWKERFDKHRKRSMLEDGNRFGYAC